MKWRVWLIINVATAMIPTRFWWPVDGLAVSILFKSFRCTKRWRRNFMPCIGMALYQTLWHVSVIMESHEYVSVENYLNIFLMEILIFFFCHKSITDTILVWLHCKECSAKWQLFGALAFCFRGVKYKIRNSSKYRGECMQVNSIHIVQVSMVKVYFLCHE